MLFHLFLGFCDFSQLFFVIAFMSSGNNSAWSCQECDNWCQAALKAFVVRSPKIACVRFFESWMTKVLGFHVLDLEAKLQEV